MAPGKKTMGRRAYWDRDLGADLDRLLELGATALVPLLEDDELERLGIEGLVVEARRRGLAVERFPFHDGGVPPGMGAAVRFVAGLCGRLERGERVVMHCNGGLGRAGTMAACLRLALGLDGSAAAAIRAVRRARGPRAIETRAQEDFIGAFVGAWRRAQRERGDGSGEESGVGEERGSVVESGVGDGDGDEDGVGDGVGVEVALAELMAGCEVVADPAAAHAQGVLAAAEAGDSGAGLEGFLAACSMDRGHPLYAADCALALESHGRGAEARQLAAGIAAQPPAGLSGFELHRIGLALSDVLGDVPRALVYLAAACEQDGGCFELPLSYGIALAECGYEEQAAVVAEGVVEQLDGVGALRPEQAYALARAAHLLCACDPLRSAAVARRALEAAPEHAGVLREAGVIALKRSDDQEALAHFRLATEVAPDDERVWGGFQYALFSLGLLEDACRVGRAILERWPGFQEVRFNTAAAGLNLGWSDEAEQVFLEYLAQDPDDAFAQVALGLCNALQGRAADARERQRRALELDGDNPEVRRISDEIDRILGAGGGPSREELGGLLLMLIAGVMGRTKKEPGS
jgi:ADP-ribosyl-[dinitrogen reductase] hydrolase